MDVHESEKSARPEISALRLGRAASYISLTFCFVLLGLALLLLPWPDAAGSTFITSHVVLAASSALLSLALHRALLAPSSWLSWILGLNGLFWVAVITARIFIFDKLSLPLALSFLTTGSFLPRSAVAALVVGTAILLIQLTRLRLLFRSPVLSLGGIVMVGLGGAAFFEDLNSFSGLPFQEVAAPIALMNALALMLIGTGVSALVWNSYPLGNLSSRDLWRTMTTYLTVAMVTISCMSTIFVALPLHTHMREQLKDQLALITASKAQTIEQYLLMAREVSLQSSLRLDDALATRTAGSLRDWNLSRFVHGMSRFGSESNLDFSHGVRVDEFAEIPAVKPDEISIIGLHPIRGQYYVIVVVSRMTPRPARDVYAFSSDPIKEVLRRNTEDSAISELYLGDLRDQTEIYSFDAKRDRFLVPFTNQNPYLDEVIHEIRESPGTNALLTVHRDAQCVVHAMTPTTGFFVLAWANMRELGVTPWVQTIDFMSWGILLSLIVSVAAFLMIRELVSHIERSQEQARSATRLKEAVVGAAPDAVITCSRDGKIQSFNNAARVLFQYSADQAKDHVPGHIDELFNFQGQSLLQKFENLEENEAPSAATFEGLALTAKGNSVPVECAVSRLDTARDMLGILFVRDISQRREAENSIQRSLREKDFLLREIHHRVKNNLQIISSLFRLQVGSGLSEEASRVLDESHARIKSIAIIHEHLYQSENLATLDFGMYLEKLCKELCATLGRGMPCEVKVDAEHVTLSVDKAVPCGLLVTELITNSLKHAFPNGERGNIEVTFRKSGAFSYDLEIRDDGVGFEESGPSSGPSSGQPPDVTDSGSQKRALGLRLVERLTQQLGARAARESAFNLGTRYHVTFEDRMDQYGKETHTRS